MDDYDEPGRDKVSAATRAFERIDEQVSPGAGRGPTPEEEAAAEHAPPLSERTRLAYQEMVFRGATQQGSGRIP